jgi:hypothetical protein
MDVECDDCIVGSEWLHSFILMTHQIPDLFHQTD